ncbi:MAG: sugar phosphate isomerase/epimerase family protein [Capsulimonadaceae bacterium]
MKVYFRLGVSMWSYVSAWRSGAIDIPGFIREAARLGADGVELLECFWKDRAAEMPAVRDVLTETGLPVGVYSIENDLAVADTAKRAAEVDVIRAGVDTAVELGARTVRVFAGDARPGVSSSRALSWIVDGLGAAAEYAYERGVTLALENRGRLAGRADQVEAILKAVASPALKANPDTASFLLNHEVPHDAVDRLATRAAMAHVTDFELMPDEYAGPAHVSIDGVKYAGRPVGAGGVDIADCINSLRQAGFTGWLDIEFEGEQDPFTAVAESVEYVRRLLA